MKEEPQKELPGETYLYPNNITFLDMLAAGGCSRYSVLRIIENLEISWADVGTAVCDPSLAVSDDKRIEWAAKLLEKIQRTCIRRAENLEATIDPLTLWLFHLHTIRDELDDGDSEEVSRDAHTQTPSRDEDAQALLVPPDRPIAQSPSHRHPIAQSPSHRHPIARSPSHRMIARLPDRHPIATRLLNRHPIA